MGRLLNINHRRVGLDYPVYIIAEMSANHHQNFGRAVEIIEAAAEAGADAIKIQTYTPDTLTIDCKNEYFQIKGTLWEGRSLYNLYEEAYMPWEWQPKLKEVAHDLGLNLFSTAYDTTAVDFLEDMDVPAYKVASFELVDLPLLRKIAQTDKPIIMSTGMATLAEIDEAVRTIREAGGQQLALLKCTSAYPALPEEMNLRTIPHLAQTFSVPTGLSDHTLGIAVPVAAIALGACIVEKHLTFSHDELGPDSSFSLEPHDFKAMVDAIRMTEKALGEVRYEVTEREQESRIFRRSLFVVKDMKAGEELTAENVHSIRPGYGLPPKYLKDLLGRPVAQDVKRGTPFTWDLAGGYRHNKPTA
jgi:N-acetylneuraminate synthase